MRIWDPHTGQTRHTLTGHTSAVPALAVAPDGTWLASAGDDDTVRIWDPHTGQTRHTLTGHTDAVQALAVAPDGSWLASAGDDGTVRIWDPHTGQTRHTLTGHTSRCGRWRWPRTAPGWPPPATTARCGSGTRTPGRPATPSPATPTRCGRWRWPRTGPGWPPPATTRTVRIWDPHTGQTRHTLTGHTSAVQALAVAPDGSWLASASDDATVRIWSIGGRCCAASFRTGHALRTVVTDGRWVAVAGDRGPYFLAVTGLLTPDSGVSPMRR